MIKSKADLRENLRAHKEALGIQCKWFPILGKEIWKFQVSLRNYEYALNCRRGGVYEKFWKFINHHYALKLGFSIPPNTFGKGLNIHHYGGIIVNEFARIGENCNLQQCVNIGQNYSSENVPTIGNNVYIGPGAKIFGKISIADGCAIGAGAVVCKSFLKPDMIIVGNPAHEAGKRKPGLK